MDASFYASTLIADKLSKQKTTKHTLPFCLFADLDDTYLLKYWPSEKILEKYSQKYTDTILSLDVSLYEPSLKLKQFLNEQHIPLIVVTGRDLHQMNELIRSFHRSFPKLQEVMNFDGIIGAVGTEIYLKSHDGEYRLDTHYKQIVQASRFNREAVYEVLEQMIEEVRKKFHPVQFDFCKRDMKNAKNELPKLDFKISYEFKSSELVSQKILDYINQELIDKDLKTIHLLMSCPYKITDTVNKYNVDIVPFTKVDAIQYLKKEFRISSVVAGDSGNDTDMLTESADFPIIVGNAKKELRDSLLKLSEKQRKKYYFASNNLSGPEAILAFLTLLVLKT